MHKERGPEARLISPLDALTEQFEDALSRAIDDAVTHGVKRETVANLLRLALEDNHRRMIAGR